jgi:G protein-coupled receptor 158
MTEAEPAESAVSPTQLTAVAVASSRAKYTCVCKEGFYVPNETLQGFTSDKVESEAGNFSSCVPCPGGCLMCDKDGSCIYGHEEPEEILSESVLRASIGAILGACVGCCLILSCIVFRQRKCKVRLFFIIIYYLFIDLP